MMKKLLIFMLVLGLTSVANAVLIGVELSIDGVTDGAGTVQETTIAVCETIVVDVHGPAEAGWYGVVAIMGSFPGVTGGEWGDEFLPVLPSCSSYYYEDMAYPIVYRPEAGDDAAFARRYEYAAWGYGYELNAAAFVGQPAGGKQFELLFHCCLEEDVTIQLWDAFDWTLADTIIVHQVPEPATMLLLGLGGLFLRRRK